MDRSYEQAGVKLPLGVVLTHPLVTFLFGQRAHHTTVPSLEDQKTASTAGLVLG